MVNQIAANVAHHPRDRQVAQIAADLRRCWAPATAADLFAYLCSGGLDLSALAAAAAEEPPASTTRCPAE